MLKHDSAVNSRTLNRLAIDNDAAFFMRKKAGDNAQQRCLAASARSDNCHELAINHGERNIDERWNLTGFAFKPIPFGDVLDFQFYRRASFDLRSSSALIVVPNSFSKNPSFTRRSTALLSTTVLKLNAFIAVAVSALA